MSTTRSITLALAAAAAFATPLLAGATANAQERVIADRAVAQPQPPTSQRIASGTTEPGVGWQLYNGGEGLFIDVDTSAAHFTGNPHYLVSLAGVANQWQVVGGNRTYNDTATGFRVYIQWADKHPMTIADAVNGAWHINWIGVDSP